VKSDYLLLVMMLATARMMPDEEIFLVCDVRYVMRDNDDEEKMQYASQPIFMRVSLTSLLCC
jgi:hypothetical protein